MKFWIHFFTITICLGLISRFCYSSTSYELNIPLSTRATGSLPIPESSTTWFKTKHTNDLTYTQIKWTIDEVYSLTVKSFDGKLIHLSDFKGKIILLNFWASRCLDSYQQLFYMDDFVKKVNSKDLVVVCVSEEPEEDITKYKKELSKFSFPMHTFVDDDLPLAFYHEYIPVTFFISPEGKILLQREHSIETNEMLKLFNEFFPKKANTK